MKAENPECSNGEISRLLSLKWKEAPEEVKQEYRDAESALWVVYKEGMAEFRKKHDGRKRTKKDPDNEEESDSRKKQQKGPKDEEFDNTSLGSDSFDDPTFTALGSAEPTNFHSQDGECYPLFKVFLSNCFEVCLLIYCLCRHHGCLGCT